MASSAKPTLDDDSFDAIADNLLRSRAGPPERRVALGDVATLFRAEAAHRRAAALRPMSPGEEQAAPIWVGDGEASPAWHGLPARLASLWRAVPRGPGQRVPGHVQLQEEAGDGASLSHVAALRQVALVLIGMILGVSGCKLLASPSAPATPTPAPYPPPAPASFAHSLSRSNPSPPPPPPPPRPPPPRPPPPTVHRQYVPHTLIQYGPPRTATTLQHAALCVVMFLLHPDEPGEVHCAKGTIEDQLLPSTSKYTVYKTHNPNAPSDFVGRSWLFVTSEAAGDDVERAAAQATAELGVPVHYAQTLGALSSRGYRYAADYGPIFGLTVDETDQLLDYLRYWDTLRQCCGSQMSSDWRAALQGSVLNPAHRSFGSSTYPACEIFDMDMLERNLLRTRVVLRFGDSDEAILKQVTNHMDPPLTGTYCRLSNAYVATHPEAQFNHPVQYADLHH